ncbi:hypothetical protein [Shewanella chilikensis]|uniref:hypothetical protein n=1 Tax=Shewanella TaxID=22 RepID=UPI0030060049
MKRSVEITDNSFFSIFSDAVLLYDLASSESNEHVRRTLSTSSILSVNYALEAAANSFLKSVDINSKISAQVDRFSTLDKFDFILQWHKDISLPRGDSETQIVKKLIEQRNQLVHPKVKVIKQDVVTSPGDDAVAYYHKADDSDSFEKCKITKMSLNPSNYGPEDSLIALKSLVNFLNKLVESWWGIDVPTSEILLMKSWNGSIQANPIMYDQNELKVVLKHNDTLNIRFAGLYGILEEYA